MSEIHRPRTLESALGLLVDHPGARALAGGTTLVPQVHRGLRVAHVVSLEGVDALWGVDERAHSLAIGAAAPLSAVLDHEALDHAPLLVEALIAVGSPQHRNRATLGGEVVCNGEVCTALMALDARIHVSGPGGPREATVDALELLPTELVTSIEVPQHGDTWCYRRVAWREALAPAQLILAATLNLQDGIVGDARVAVGGEGVLSYRSALVEASLAGSAPVGRRAELLHNDVGWDDPRAAWRLRAAKNLLRTWLDALV